MHDIERIAESVNAVYTAGAQLIAVVTAWEEQGAKPFLAPFWEDNAVSKVHSLQDLLDAMNGQISCLENGPLEEAPQVSAAIDLLRAAMAPLEAMPTGDREIADDVIIVLNSVATIAGGFGNFNLSMEELEAFQAGFGDAPKDPAIEDGAAFLLEVVENVIPSHLQDVRPLIDELTGAVERLRGHRGAALTMGR